MTRGYVFVALVSLSLGSCRVHQAKAPAVAAPESSEGVPPSPIEESPGHPDEALVPTGTEAVAPRTTSARKAGTEYLKWNSPPSTAKKEPICKWTVDGGAVGAADQALFLTDDEYTAALAEHLPYGIPKATRTLDNARLLASEHFVILYDDDLYAPLWTAHTMTAEDLKPKLVRTSAFRSDPRLPQAVRSTCRDYKEPIFDQGHMVPNADMTRGISAMLNTYTMANMTPQQCGTNQGVWMIFEKFVRDWVKDEDRGRATIVTGALYDWDDTPGQDPDAKVPRMKPERGERRVGVPSHLYKIVLHEKANGFIETISIMVKNDQAKLSKSGAVALLKNGITTIDEIEQLTGFRFLPELANQKGPTEQAVTSFKAADLWEHGTAPNPNYNMYCRDNRPDY